MTDDIIRASSSTLAASLRHEYGLVPSTADGSAPSEMPPYIQGTMPDETFYFAAIVGEINGDGACWGRLRWGAETPPQFPPGLTVYVPQPDGSFVPPLDPAIDAAIPVIG